MENILLHASRMQQHLWKKIKEHDLERCANLLQKKSAWWGGINKTALYAGVGCGMIRVSPDMLRSVCAYCVLTGFCREKQRTHFV